MTIFKKHIIEPLLFPKVKFNSRKLKSSVNGKTIVITGASYGIGEQTAYLLAHHGAKIILVARTESKLLEVKKTIENNNGKADIFVADLTKNEELDQLIDFLMKIKIDVFVNNAGKSIRRSIFDALDRAHDFSRTMNLNYHAPVRLMLSLIPVFVEKKAHIINVSSASVLLPSAPKWAAYQASKTAFDSWFSSVSKELTDKKVNTSTLYLPLVKTRMIAPTKQYDNVPAMQPKEVAKAIAKLLVNKRNVFKPWWLFFGQLGAIMFPKLALKLSSKV